MPMEHSPLIVFPDCGVPKSISVSPLAGSIALYHTSRMTRAEEQSYVFAVFIISFVGIESIVVFRGLYPHFALIVTYWMPFFITTLLDTQESLPPLPPTGPRMRKKNTIAKIITERIVSTEAVSKDFFDIYLEIKKRRNNSETRKSC